MEKVYRQLALPTTKPIRRDQEIKWWEVKEKPDKVEVIRKIESRNKEDVIKLLKSNNLGINRDIKLMDLSVAKQICFEELFINSDIYDKQIGWICDWLKI